MKKHLFITFLTFLLALPTTWANDIPFNITQTQSVAEIQTGLQAAIDNATVNDRVVVAGSKTNANVTLTLTIPADKTVVWQATYQSSAAFFSNTLVMFLGDGTFEVAGGTLTATEAMTINSYGEHATVIVSGGAVSATSENAIIARGKNAKVFVSGGTVSNDANGNYPVIYMYNQNNTELNVIISGTGKVEAKPGAHRSAIHTNGDVKLSDYAQVSSAFDSDDGAHGTIYAAGNVEIGGNAQVNSKNLAISARKNVIVKDNAQITGTIEAINITVGDFAKVKGNDIEAFTLIANGDIKVSNHAQITAIGISAIIGVTIIVDGGVVLAQTDSISHVISPPQYFSGPTHTGLILAWNKEAGNTNYEIYSTDDILKSPESATAYWDRKGNEYGISYANGENTGFIPLDVNVLSIDEHCLSNLKVYPNPTSGILTIRVNENASERVNGIEIFDIYGKKQFSSTCEPVHSSTIDISHLSAGIYFLRAGGETVKIVKE
jgi:hypothetical protein